MTEPDNSEFAAAPVVSAAATDDQRQSANDIDGLLTEFDSRQRPDASPDRSATGEPAPVEQPIPQAKQVSEADLHRLAMQAGADRALIEELLITQHFNEMRRQETADYQSLLKEANKYLEGSSLPEDYADRYLRAEYELNPDVKEAWDHRHDSPEAKAICDRVLKKTLIGMAKSTRVPDRNATEDREAVTAAVRGAGRAPPAENSGDYRRRVSNMTNTELDKEWQRLGM